ncbi:MAG: hypothetical protein K0R75_1313 [Paenibacillaceae bacterium]|nr:hypothetical protein [Paenibacillaceae bacterium]
MATTIALLGAFDTKGNEYAFLQQCIERNGLRTLLIDTGVLDEPVVRPDISSAEVAAAAGHDLSALRARRDRGEAVAAMGAGAEKLLPELYRQGRFAGVIALGGTGGTSLACRAMRALPIGVPKVMVSTVAGSDVSAYVGSKDIVMIPSIVDISGINSISRTVLARAAGAVCGMASAEVPTGDDKPLIAASMFGNTTKAVEAAKAIMEQQGYEVVVFHCTGTGGKTMESLIEAGMISGVLDITTTEWADQLVGGVFDAGPSRLEAAAKAGVPAIVTPGCLDMVNFGAPETVPREFAGRVFYQHNPNVTLMRTTPEECAKLGEIIAGKLNESRGPVTVLIPLRGISVISAEGQPFHSPEADEALFSALKRHLNSDIPIIEIDCNINDPAFSERCAEELLRRL